MFRTVLGGRDAMGRHGDFFFFLSVIWVGGWLAGGGGGNAWVEVNIRVLLMEGAFLGTLRMSKAPEGLAVPVFQFTIRTVCSVGSIAQVSISVRSRLLIADDDPGSRVHHPPPRPFC